MFNKFLICAWCDCSILPGDKYLQVGRQHICTDCVEDNLEEYDPEGNEIDMKTDEMIERRLNNG